jgi:diaminohydroxyphosphoribosylaminopyrimidine deaminase/5-amino-6-(5-phosphoribosylamino)uracil reductase
VEGGLLAAEAAREALEPWLHAVRHHRPYLVWKFASTLDGRVAAADGTSRWITGVEARADVHRLRAQVDAVVVGVGTVLADDPELTVRTPDGDLAERQPLRVVLDRSGRTPADARVRAGAAVTLLLAEPDPSAALRALYARDIRYALLEGGPTVAGAFLRAGCIQRIVGYLAPALLGAGPPVLTDAGICTIADALRLHLDDVRQLGDDIRITARLPGAPACAGSP